MKPKTLALILLALISFASPLVEMLVTGRVEMLSALGLAGAAVQLVLIFSWYHLDKEERNYGVGRRSYRVGRHIMNAGMLMAMVIALPIYLVSTRGWKRGAVTTALAGGFLLLTFLLGEAGEWLGAWLRA